MNNPPSYSAIYAFGDSLSDAGNVSIVTALTGRIPVSPPYSKQSYGPFGTLTATVFSNGPTWVQDLSRRLGLSTLRPSLYGGTDFAYGGAEANPDAGGFAGLEASAISLSSQLTQFKAEVIAAPSEALYTLSIGTNDLYSILETPGVSSAEMINNVSTAVADAMSFVSALVKRGAQNLLVMDVPDLGKMPIVTQQNDPSRNALASRLSNLYNIDLNAELQAVATWQSIDLHILPLYSLLNQAAAAPAQFQLVNATDPAWSGNFANSDSGALVTVAPDTYLFWDQYHPTGHVHDLIAAGARSLVTTGDQLYPTPTIEMTDTVTGLSSVQFGTVLSSPNFGLQGQFLYEGPHSIALRAETPSMFLKGGAGGDALEVLGGSNVLDGAGGSNFLIGSTGAGGGADTFFVDSRAPVETWSTIVNFHQGDMATIFGFHNGLSTRPYTAFDGADGYKGVTIHSEIDGPGTGVKGSVRAASREFALFESEAKRKSPDRDMLPQAAARHRLRTDRSPHPCPARRSQTDQSARAAHAAALGCRSAISDAPALRPIVGASRSGFQPKANPVDLRLIAAQAPKDAVPHRLTPSSCKVAQGSRAVAAEWLGLLSPSPATDLSRNCSPQARAVKPGGGTAATRTLRRGPRPHAIPPSSQPQSRPW